MEKYEGIVGTIRDLKSRYQAEWELFAESDRASMKAGGIEKYEDPEFLEDGYEQIKNLLWGKQIEEDPLSKTKTKKW